MKIEEAIKQTRPFKSSIEKAVVNILYTSGWLNDKHGGILKPYGLTGQQYNILRILKGQHPKPASVNLLIDRMLDKSSNASRLVDKLLSKGLVTREQNPADRRQVDVRLTDQGLKTLEKLNDEMTNASVYSTDLSDEELQALSNLLDRLRG